MRARFTLLLTLLLAALPVAFAQGPPPCATLTLTPAVPTTVAYGETTVTFNEVVANTGQVEAVVKLTAKTTTPGVAIQPQAHERVVRAGEQETITYTVTLPRDWAGTAAFTVDAQGSCSLNGVAGPLAAQGATSEVSLSVTAPQGFVIPGVGPVKPQHLLAAGGLATIVIVGALIARSRGHGVSLVAVEPLRSVTPGTGTSFAIAIENRGRAPSVVALRLSSPLREGWTAHLGASQLTLAARERREFSLAVHAPAQAKPGETTDVTVEAQSREEPESKVTTRVRAEVSR